MPPDGVKVEEALETRSRGISAAEARLALDGLESVFEKEVYRSVRAPAPKEELELRLSKALKSAGLAGLDIDFSGIFAYNDCRLIERDGQGNFSIFKGQPYWSVHGLPTKGVLAMPIDAYLRKNGADSVIAGQANAALMRTVRYDHRSHASELLLAYSDPGKSRHVAIATLATAVVYLNGATIDELLKIRNVGEKIAGLFMGAVHDRDIMEAVENCRIIKPYMLQDSYRFHKTESL